MKRKQPKKKLVKEEHKKEKQQERMRKEIKMEAVCFGCSKCFEKRVVKWVWCRHCMAALYCSNTCLSANASKHAMYCKGERMVLMM